MPKKVTIAEVAKEAGVSIATVSRVLNQRSGKIKISEETALAVKLAAQRLGYQADPFAVALRSGRSGLFGAIIRDIRDPFLVKVFTKMQEVARASEIELLLAHADYDLATAGRQARIMSSLWFDALILLGDIPGDVSIIQQLKEDKKPCVAVASGLREDLPSITLDEKAGTDLALDHLFSLGHRRIACVGDPNAVGIQARLQLFKAYAETHPLILEEGYIQYCANHRLEAGRCAVELMKLPTPPTAIFCGTDLIALGVINQLHRSGNADLKDVSVIGFDDLEESAEVYPALTTIRQPVDKFAEKTIHLLTGLLDAAEEDRSPARILIEPELVIRESCSPVAQPPGQTGPEK
jgi:LacI family transcriptional regulator